MNVAVDPEILEVIKASSAISTQPGSAVHLCRINNKRRRTRAEIDEFNAMQENQFQSLLDKDARISALESQLTQSKSKLQTGEQAENLVGQMLEAGALIQQEDGTFAIKKD